MFQYATSSGKEFGLAHGVSVSLISLGRRRSRSLAGAQGQLDLEGHRRRVRRGRRSYFW